MKLLVPEARCIYCTVLAKYVEILSVQYRESSDHISIIFPLSVDNKHKDVVTNGSGYGCRGRRKIFRLRGISYLSECLEHSGPSKGSRVIVKE